MTAGVSEPSPGFTGTVTGSLMGHVLDDGPEPNRFTYRTIRGALEF